MARSIFVGRYFHPHKGIRVYARPFDSDKTYDITDQLGTIGSRKYVPEMRKVAADIGTYSSREKAYNRIWAADGVNDMLHCCGETGQIPHEYVEMALDTQGRTSEFKFKELSIVPDVRKPHIIYSFVPDFSFGVGVTHAQSAQQRTLDLMMSKAADAKGYAGTGEAIDGQYTVPEEIINGGPYKIANWLSERGLWAEFFVKQLDRTHLVGEMGNIGLAKGVLPDGDDLHSSTEVELGYLVDGVHRGGDGRGRLVGRMLVLDGSINRIERINPLLVQSSKLFEGCNAIGELELLAEPTWEVPDITIETWINRPGMEDFWHPSAEVRKIQIPYETIMDVIERNGIYHGMIAVTPGSALVPESGQPQDRFEIGDVWGAKLSGDGVDPRHHLNGRVKLVGDGQVNPDYSVLQHEIIIAARN